MVMVMQAHTQRKSCMAAMDRRLGKINWNHLQRQQSTVNRTLNISVPMPSFWIHQVSNKQIMLINLSLVALFNMWQGFFPGGGTGGVPPIRRKFCQSPPPSDTCPRFWTKACPPQPRFVPENLKNLNTFFVSNLTTLKLKSTLKSCISCLK